MNKIYKKVKILFVLALLALFYVGVESLSAKNNNSQNGVTLKEKYTGKKLDRIKETIKTKKHYRFLIESDNSLEVVKNYFGGTDKKIKIKKVTNNTYLVKIPLNSTLFKEEFLKIDNGIFPTQIGEYKVIQPEIVEGFASDYVLGEEVEKLWGQTRVGADAFQQELQTKTNIKVGVLDTGIDYNHSDLDANYNSSVSYNFIDESNANLLDDNGHGTQVAGIISAEVNASGVFGVNSNTDLVSLKVLDANGIGTTYDILDAIEYAKLNDIKVLNMSFGGTGNPDNNTVCQAISDAKTAGIYTVVSAGNNNTDISHIIPAGCSDAITVGAINQSAEVSSFSNSGTGVSIYAPGETIYTTDLNDSYSTVNGTSFSAPFITGLISKELAYSRSISYNDLMNNLEDNYNLLEGLEGSTINNTGSTSTGDAIFTIPEINTYERFNELKYLNHSDHAIYYADRSHQEYVYKLVISSTGITIPEVYLDKFPNIIFSQKKNFLPEYFNSGEYISPDLYAQELNIMINDDFVESFQTPANQSLGKYNLDFKFDQVSGKLIQSIGGYPAGENDNYIFYRKHSDNYKLHSYNKYSQENNLIVSIDYTYPDFIDDIYIYYRNRDDSYKLYRAKIDGSDAITGGEKILNIEYSYGVHHDKTYFYYQNRNDNNKLYRAKKDGTDITSGGEVVINIPYSYPVIIQDNYVIYTNYDDNYYLYKASIDTSDADTGGIKLIDYQYPYPIAHNSTDAFYIDWNTGGGIYKFSLDGSNSNSKGLKLLNTAENGYIDIWEAHLDGDYIYYTERFQEDKLFRLKTDGSDIINGANLLSDNKYNRILSIQGDNIYFTSWDSDIGVGIYKIKKDGSEYTQGAIKLTGISGEFVSTDTQYLNYYYCQSSSCDYFKVKLDGTDDNLYLNNKEYRSSTITLQDDVEYIKINLDTITPTGTDYKFYIANSRYGEYFEMSKSQLNGSSNIDLISLFGLDFAKELYYRIELVGNYNDQTITPEIKSVEIFTGDYLTREISRISIAGSSSCTRPFYSSHLSLFSINDDGEEVRVYGEIYKKDISRPSSSYTTSWCGGGGWLWGYKYVGNSCSIAGEPIDLEDSYEIPYTCQGYYARSSGAASGPGFRTEINWGGSFVIDKSRFSMCGLDPKYCISKKSARDPLETVYNYQIRVNESITQNETNPVEATGDPVNLYSGEFIYDNTLMQHSSKGMPFEFKVDYKNQTYYDGPIGNNFDHSYNLYIEEQTDGNVYFYNGKLGVSEFISNESGFDYNKTINTKLELVNGQYVMTMNNSKVYTFNSDLKIESIGDNYGNTFSFSYNNEKQLISITDSNSRVYTLAYNADGKLQGLRDFNGNKVEFIYFTDGETEGSKNDLKTIRTINGDSTKDISFTYTLGSDEVTSHNIIKLIDSENNVYVENTYDTGDRVASQKYGDGTIYYNYTLNSEDKIAQNSVTTRTGNQVIYTYDEFGNTTQKIVKKSTGDGVYSYEYNSDNYVVREILPLGNGYTYSYDANYNLIEKRQKADVNAADSSGDIVTSYIYDLNFNIPTQIIYPNGLIVNFTLDANGKVIQKEIIGVQDVDGNSLTIVENYEYNSLGELIKLTDAKGNISEFEYLNGNLVKTIKPLPNPPLTGEGIATEYSYDSKGNITSITDGEGNITNLSYDDFNLISSLQTPEGISSEFTHNKLNKKINEKIILSSTESVDSSYSYDILDNPTVITQDIDASSTKTIVTEYDADSRITQVQSGNNAPVNFVYNEEGFIIEKIISPQSSPSQGEEVAAIVTKYAYDSNNRLVKQVNPNTSEIVFEYDLFDRVVKQTLSDGTYTTLSYDNVGNVTQTNTYNSLGELVASQSNNYDLLSRVIQTTTGISTDQVTNKTYYDAIGNIVKQTSPQSSPSQGEEVATLYSYDSLNRLKTITDPLGNVVSNSYDKNNNLVERTLTPTLSQSEEGVVPIITSYSYDSDSRVIKEINNKGEEVSYTYNNLNQIVSKTDKDLGVTTYSYDYTGNLLEESHEGKTTKYEYDIDGNMTKLIDPNNNETLYVYDSLNRLIKQTYPDGNFTTYEYDLSGNIVKRVDPNGTVVNQNYDALNRLISRNISTGTGVLGATSENYSYDALGRVVSATDNLGNDLSFDYDSLNRLVNETSPHPNPLPGGEGNYVVNYTYDVSGNITSITSPQSSPSQGEEVATVYTYDVANRLTSISRGTQDIADYSYDSLTKTSQTLANGVITNYGYDELLRLSSLGNFDYTYNTQGNITSDGKDHYSYDSLDRLTGVNYDEVNIPEYNGDKIERFFYDAMGNRTSQENYSLKDVTTESCTDETIVDDVTLPNGKVKTVERKQTVCETATTQVEKQKNTLSYTTNSLNQYTKLQTLNKNGEVKKKFTYEYDNNGNLSKDDINQYFYDYKNRLVKVIQNEVVKLDDNNEIIEIIPEVEIVNYTYDILGRRIEKKTEEKTITYIYASQNAIKEIITDNETNGIIETRENIYSNSLDDILSTIITEYNPHPDPLPEGEGVIATSINQYFYEKNHLGSIIRITDITGAIVEQYEYDAFGVAYASINNVEAVTQAQGKKKLNIKKAKGSEASNNGDTDELVIDNIRYKRYNGKGKIGNTRLYTGREYDAELQLYYNRARYYSPDLGRFISRDPIDITDDINLYAYVGNNGVMYSDRMGLKKVLIMYSPNKRFERKTTEKTSINIKNNLVNIGYNSDYISIKSIKTADDFIDQISKFTTENNNGEIYYVGHNKGWLSKNMTNNKIKELPNLDISKFELMLATCNSVADINESPTYSNQIAINLSKQLNINVYGSTEKVGPTSYGVYIPEGSWKKVTPEDFIN